MVAGEIERMAAEAPPWRHHMVGQGWCEQERGLLRLVIQGAVARGLSYSDAQIDDYRLWPRGWQHRDLAVPGGLSVPRPFIRRPPLRLRLRARMSHPEGALLGTAGFGFWNYPITLPPRPPRAIWFFYGSPPNEMPLAMGVPGRGWKAAVVDTGRARALALLPFAPLIVPLLSVPALYRGLYPPLQRAVGVAESLVRAPIAQWHEYEIVWGERRSRFLVDGRVVLDEAPSPRGPMCFVAWVDNQYLVLTPQGAIRWGLLEVPQRQWLELADLVIEPG
jgi:hypothetical protein